MALKGFKVIELAGLAPAPFCGMILSDFGATVTRIDKPNPFNGDKLCRGKRSIVLDIRKPQGVQVLQKLCLNADVLIEPFRAGVMEKLHLGPSDLLHINPRLVYARLTGFGQRGPFSKMAGHDINYIAIAGVLSTLGRHHEKPQHPVNLLGDFGGGGLICALGICMALLERYHSGKGQVIDANMVAGSAYLSSFLWTTRDPKFHLPFWTNSRGKNLLDGGAPYYQTYKTKDHKFMAVGALEPQFYQELLKGLGLNEDDHPHMSDWEKTEETFTKIFLTKTQAEWCEIFNFKDACVTPVLSLEEAPQHSHNAACKNFLNDGNYYFPRPAPEFSRTPAKPNLQEPLIGEHTREVLLEVGYKKEEIDELIKAEIVATAMEKAKL